MKHILRMQQAIAKRMWAEKHISHLNDWLQADQQAQRYRLESVGDSANGRVRFVELSPPPAELSFIIGDVVNNLRTALDYAICALLLRDDPTTALRRASFPYGHKGQPLTRQQRENTGMQNASPRTKDVIELARNSQGEALDFLNRLSNQDKHRLIIPVFLTPRPFKFAFSPDWQDADLVPDLEAVGDTWGMPLKDGDIITMPKVLKVNLGLKIDNPCSFHALEELGTAHVGVRSALEMIAQSI